MRAVLESCSQPWRNGEGILCYLPFGKARLGMEWTFCNQTVVDPFYLFIYLFVYFLETVSLFHNRRYTYRESASRPSIKEFVNIFSLNSLNNPLLIMMTFYYSTENTDRFPKVCVKRDLSHVITTTASGQKVPSKYNFALWRAVFRYFRIRFTLYNMDEEF